MAKSVQSRERTRMTGRPSVGAALAEPAQVSGPEKCEEIAKLAYLYWLGRGCPEGSPEDDWLRAEQEIQQKLNQPAK